MFYENPNENVWNISCQQFLGACLPVANSSWHLSTYHISMRRGVSWSVNKDTGVWDIYVPFWGWFLIPLSEIESD